MATRQPARQSTRSTAKAPAGRKTAAKTPRRRSQAAMKEIPHDLIRRRAYEIYCARGGFHGRDVDDWLQAERELRGTPKR